MTESASLPPLEMLTPKDPPKNGTQANLDLLVALRDGDSEWLKKATRFAPGAIQALAYVLVYGRQLPRQTLRRTHAYRVTSFQTRTWSEIEEFSHDVVAMLPSAEFWQALRVDGNAWQLGEDLPRGEVALEFGPEGLRSRWSHATPLIPFASYLASLEALERRLSVATGELEIARMTGADAMPQLLMALHLGLDGQQHKFPYTCSLIDVVSAVSSVAVQRLKHCLRVPRPSDDRFGLVMEPRLEVPKYSAFPAGHAAVCAAIATVLIKICEADAPQATLLEALVADIAEDRERAGLHCEIDNREGLALGRAIGSWMLLAVDEPDAFRTWSALFMKAAQEWDPPPETSESSEHATPTGQQIGSPK